MPRLRLSDEEASIIEAHRNGLVAEKVENITSENNYTKPKIGFTAIGDNGLLMNIEEYCDHYKLDHTKIRSYKLISHTAIPFYNIVFYTTEEDKLLKLPDYFEEIIQKHIKPVFHIQKEDKGDWFDRLVYTDIHIGMDVSGNGDPLYNGKWDKDEVMRRLSIMINHTITNKKSDLLIIDNLGDYMDGLGGETTRRGHELPQNMNDKEAFDLGVSFGVKLVDSLISRYNKIICNNIVEDNHSGVFGYFVSQAIKGILEQKYHNVEVNSQKKFIDFYKVGKHTFITSHGKDSEALKFGFKPHLDDKQAKKIDHFCKEYLLYDGNFIEFSKGDSHLSLFDDSTSTDFHYYNYPAFSPPSNWVKSNFSNTKSGFRFFNIKKEENVKIHHPYWF